MEIAKFADSYGKGIGKCTGPMDPIWDFRNINQPTNQPTPTAGSDPDRGLSKASSFQRKTSRDEGLDIGGLKSEMQQLGNWKKGGMVGRAGQIMSNLQN